MELVSFNELDLFDESDDFWSGSVSPGKYVGSACGVGFGNFFSNGIESLGNLVPLVVFIPRIVKSKGCQLIESFFRSKY